MLPSDCEKIDPRIRRTRGLLQDSLRNLLTQKEFDRISVQDITEAATLNRATFYAHYADKYALLGELIRVSFLDFLAQRDVQYNGGCSTAFKVILLAVCDYLNEVQKSLSANEHQFESFVEATVIDQIGAVLLDGCRRPPVERMIPAEMVAATASWAIYGAVKQWIQTKDRAPAEAFVEVAVELVRPIITAGEVTTPGR